jgi:hypothetical protein
VQVFATQARSIQYPSLHQIEEDPRPPFAYWNLGTRCYNPGATLAATRLPVSLETELAEAEALFDASFPFHLTPRTYVCHVVTTPKSSPRRRTP